MSAVFRRSPRSESELRRTLFAVRESIQSKGEAGIIRLTPGSAPELDRSLRAAKSDLDEIAEGNAGLRPRPRTEAEMRRFLSAAAEVLDSS